MKEKYGVAKAGTYENHPVLSITRDDNRVITFGQAVARTIVNNIDDVKAWLADVDLAKTTKAKANNVTISEKDMAKMFASFMALAKSGKLSK